MVSRILLRGKGESRIGWAVSRVPLRDGEEASESLSASWNRSLSLRRKKSRKAMSLSKGG
jgi:hypothetical protein